MITASGMGGIQAAAPTSLRTGTDTARNAASAASLAAVSIWDVLEKLAKLKQEAIEKADSIAKTMSADDDEATKAQKQRELAKATAFIEDVQKKIEKMTETAHTTSSSRL